MRSTAYYEQLIQDLTTLEGITMKGVVRAELHRGNPAKHPADPLFQDIDVDTVAGALRAIQAQVRIAREGLFIAALTEQLANVGACVLRVSAMDCDCARYSYAATFDNVDDALEWREGQYMGAEGPTSVYLVDEVDPPESRDLALEAFEDGHAHCVYT